MMELILWRHAEAHDAKEGQDDLERALTPRGEKQAARMSAWLERQLPQGLRVVSSPARRTEQTAQALGRKYKLRAELLPDGTPTDLLELVQWEKGNGAVLVVGSILGLLAFVLALNLSNASSRFERRVEATLQEVNAIGTAVFLVSITLVVIAQVLALRPARKPDPA